MTVVFDMDNTLVDEFGSGIRPGIVPLLNRLKRDGHSLVLWTNSRRQRALEILSSHDLRKYFSRLIFRENYDPDEKDVRKDIRLVKGDVLIDDDPQEIQFVKSIGKAGLLISPFRKGMDPGKSEITLLYKTIAGLNRKNRNFFRR